jgi:3-hydroxyacyl-[acyl-carrier-protein] dehydratase
MTYTSVESLDIERILEALPHRYPFVLVDRVTEMVSGSHVVARKMVSANEPWCLGHFPGHPIMPGVLVIEALAQAGGILAHVSDGASARGGKMLLLGIDKAKFRRPVAPGDRLDLRVEISQRRGNVWRFRGEARVDGALCAQAELLTTIVEAS